MNRMFGVVVAVVVALAWVSPTTPATPVSGRDEKAGAVQPVRRFGDPRWRNGDPVDGGDFSPDGSLLAVAGGPVVRLFDARDGTVVRSLKGHTRRVTSVAFSPDGRRLLSSGIDGTLRLWDVESGEQRRLLVQGARYVIQAAFAPAGGMIAAGVDVEYRRQHLALFNGADGGEIARIDVDAHRLAFSPDGRFVATNGGYDRRCLLIDVLQKKVVRELAPKGTASACAFTPDSRRVLLHRTYRDGAKNAVLDVQDVSTGRVVQTIAFPADPNPERVWCAPDGRTVVCTRASIDLAAGTAAPLPESIGAAFAMSKDGGRIAAHRGYGVVALLDLASRKETSPPTGHLGAVHVVVPSADGKELQTFGADRRILTWDARSGVLLRWSNVEALSSSRFSVSSDSRVVAGVDPTQRVVAFQAGSPRLLSSTRDGGAWQTALSPDGGILATVPLLGAKDPSIRLFDVRVDALKAKFDAGIGRLQAIAYSPDGRTIAVGSRRSVLRLLDAATGRAVGAGLFRQEVAKGAPESRTLHLVFSPDGRILVWQEHSGVARLIDVEKGVELRRISGCHRPIAFSADGRLFAAGDGGTGARIWDPATGAELAHVEGHSNHVQSLAFSPDGRRLYTGGADGLVMEWAVASAPDRAR